MGRLKPSRFTTSSLLSLMVLLIVAAVQAQSDFVPNGTLFPNPDGASSTYSTTGGGIDLTGPFFQSLGTNDRSCGSCHQPSDGMSVSAAHVQQRFDATGGTDPIFRPVDGSNCNVDAAGRPINVSKTKLSDLYSLLRTRGLIRIGISVPAGADFTVESVENTNPYSAGCRSTTTISMYRRPLPSTNLRFLSAVMFDGRESSSATGTNKILFTCEGTPVTTPPCVPYPTSLLNDLAHQSVDATRIHAQRAPNNPIDEPTQRDIVAFEMALFTAQATGNATGRLDAQGANGGPIPLIKQRFFISINSSLGPALEPPSGLKSPGDGRPFTPTIFDIFDEWRGIPPYKNARAAVERGQDLFNSKIITIRGVNGINDLLPGGMASSSLDGTCGTCHDTPNVGNHSFPTPLNIGVGDFLKPDTPCVEKDKNITCPNTGGLDIRYLPKIKVCQTGTSNCVVTTDLGQALIDGKYAHVGKIKGPILRGLSARAPFFHNGAAKTLLDVVNFYDVRFDIGFSSQEKDDLVAFLSSL